MSEFTNIFYGVSSGVLTTVLLFILYRLKLHVYDPWWENRLYKGVFLDGSWFCRKVKHFGCTNCQAVSRAELKMKMDLDQKGYSLSGFFSAKSLQAAEAKESVYSNFYKIKGHIHDNYVV